MPPYPPATPYREMPPDDIDVPPSPDAPAPLPPWHRAGSGRWSPIPGPLLIIAGFLAITFGLFLIVNRSMLREMYGEMGVETNMTFFLYFGISQVVLGLAPLIGGILQIARPGSPVVRWLAIVGIFAMGPSFISTVLCLIAFVMIRRGERPPPAYAHPPHHTWGPYDPQEYRAPDVYPGYPAPPYRPPWEAPGGATHRPSIRSPDSRTRPPRSPPDPREPGRTRGRAADGEETGPMPPRGRLYPVRDDDFLE